MTFLELLLIFAIIIFIGYVIKSLTGFAGALFSVPLLALFFDIKLIVPVVSMIDLFAGVILFPSIKSHINKKEVVYVVIGALIGTAIGVYFLNAFADDTLKVIFGIVVILFSLKMIFEKHIEKYFTPKKLKSCFGTLFGMIGGITGGMFSADGPPIALYAGHQIRNKQILRSTLISIFLINTIWRNSLYFFTGLFTAEIAHIVLFMIPVLLIATVIGSKIHFKINEEIYRKIIGVIILISGIILVL